MKQNRSAPLENTIPAIRNGDLDGNDETARVADWEPLIDCASPKYRPV